jgi:hypothetical protein
VAEEGVFEVGGGFEFADEVVEGYAFFQSEALEFDAEQTAGFAGVADRSHDAEDEVAGLEFDLDDVGGVEADGGLGPDEAAAGAEIEEVSEDDGPVGMRQRVMVPLWP